MQNAASNILENSLKKEENNKKDEEEEMKILQRKQIKAYIISTKVSTIKLSMDAGRADLENAARGHYTNYKGIADNIAMEALLKEINSSTKYSPNLKKLEYGI